MENNPKKSKAFIITFILILLLLLAGYYLFTNRSSIFDTKGSTSFSKIFSPLLGTSTGKNLTTIDTGNKTPAVNTNTLTGIIITDKNGNKIVRAEAGEDLKKGDVLYISGFNKNKDPIVMKAIAKDKSKSLVFGVAAQDIKKGDMLDVIIEGTLTGVPTNRVEKTPWATNNPLYLSDIIYGGMTKNPPLAPSFVVNVGSVLKVDPINGSIHIGGITNNANLKAINSQLLNNSGSDLRDYWNSIFGGGNNSAGTNNYGFVLTPINLPGSGVGNYPLVTVTASLANIAVGDSTTITWTSKNTISCNAGKGRGTGVLGTFDTGPLKESMAYSVECTGSGGVGSGNVFIFVGNNTNIPFPSVTVTANPTSVVSGNKSTISWRSINATSCNAGTGNSTKTSGSFSTSSLMGDTAYTIYCTGTYGTVSNTAYVTIAQTAVIPDTNNTTTPQCSDLKDNDGDGLIDAKDPDCHDGGDLNATYEPTHDSESVAPPASDTTTTVNACALISDNPLVFTEDEKARLAVLLRKFYLISSSLKTVEDITTTSNEIDQNQNFIAQIEDLTQQCYSQVGKDDNSGIMALHNGKTIDPSSTSIPKSVYPKWVRHGNPWYSKANDGDFPYSKKGDVGYLDYDQLDGGATPAGYKAISGYYYGTTTDGTSCDQYNNFEGYGLSTQINNQKIKYLGHYDGANGREANLNGGGYPGDSIMNSGVSFLDAGFKVSLTDGGHSLDDRQPDKKILESGCYWKDGVELQNTERLLNIW